MQNKFRIRSAAPSVLLAAGAALVCFGIGMIFLPAGVIAAGLMLGLTGISLMAAGEEAGDGDG